MADISRFVDQCKVNLERGRACATGIGVFVVLIKGERTADFDERQFLLRRRLEKDSLLGVDLSGKWEMTGGGVELSHFTTPQDYQGAVLKVLQQELQEEAGLTLEKLPWSFSMLPAWLYNTDRGILDLAFVTPLDWLWVQETPEFQEKLQRGELRFFRKEELGKIEIVSPRTRFLINTAIEFHR